MARDDRTAYGLTDLLGIAFLITWERLDRIEGKLDRIIRMEHQEMADLDRITASVTAEGDAVNSAVTLLGELAQLVRDAGTDPAALAALADQIDAQKQTLADAVVANTPAAPPPLA